ncbi:S-adenosylmethionine carrier 1, chloroplastic/mitochondrial [Morella rubra]|uniref:S-adenosylmethionine carrier 1, chloroplastic/mitochondrial n=1 Tax=Morella rubra TaxID=262757 RepID=A0A6A1VE30_9ROSI|nr:S-adenosylmethionine carrier 1, chloroplastic/mitochondrial [Morella rubra]
MEKAVHGGQKINLKGLYSGLSGNLAGVLPASALFVGVYEPTKQKLLKMFPENLSAAAHLTAGAIGGLAASLIRVPTEVVKQRSSSLSPWPMHQDPVKRILFHAWDTNHYPLSGDLYYPTVIGTVTLS